MGGEGAICRTAFRKLPLVIPRDDIRHDANIREAFAAAVRFHKGGQWVSAAAAYRRVLAVAPKHIPTLLNLGRLLDREGKLPEAAEFFDKAAKADPHNARAWEDLGNALIRLEQWDEAEEALRKAVVRVPASSRTWLNLGHVLLQSNCWSESEAAFREALRLNYPDRVEAWNNLGYALTAQKKYHEAEEVLRRAILIAPTRPQLWRNLRRALIGQDRFAEAEEAKKTRLRLLAIAQSPPSEFASQTVSFVSQQNVDGLVSHCLTHEGRQLSLSADDVRSLHCMVVNRSVKRRGEFRRGSVFLGGDIFFPPSWKEVPALISEFCTYLNTEWEGGDVFHLGAYALWRLAAIHPFEDGNGRVARSLCFALMRVKDGRFRPCRFDRSKYVASVKQAVRLFAETHDIHLSTRPVEEWLRKVFEQALLKTGRD